MISFHFISYIISNTTGFPKRLCPIYAAAVMELYGATFGYLSFYTVAQVRRQLLEFKFLYESILQEVSDL